MSSFSNFSTRWATTAPPWVCCRSYLSDGHGAEDVEEDKGAVCVILAQQVAMRQALDVGERHEWQPGHDSSVEAKQKKWDEVVCLHILRTVCFGQMQTIIPHQHHFNVSLNFGWLFL